MSKEKGVPFKLQVEEHLNPLANVEEGDEEEEFESMVAQSNKKTKKKIE